MKIGEFTLTSEKTGKKYVFIMKDDGTCVTSYPTSCCEEEREEFEEDFRLVAERLIKVLQSV